jgi:hypothetical protein
VSAARRTRTTVALVASIALCSGCRVIAELIENDPRNGAAPDALLPSDPRCGAWSHAPETFDPCDVPPSSMSLELGDGVWVFDTNSGSLTDPDDNATFPASALITAQSGVEARALSIERLSLSGAATLYVRGKRPLIIVSWSDADLHGVIDVTSRSGMPAAGSNPDVCTATAAGIGADSVEGAGGGGGGGFGTSGAAGGAGDDGLATAGSAGAMAPIATFRGGCAGGAGGNALHGVAGDGGGAVVIAARELVTLNGVVTAGGAGGGAAQGGRAGGGGGGSGGYVGLAGPSVVLGPGAIVAANGGGGGGGSDGSPATVGQDGQPAAMAAAPGQGQGMGSSGGAGGARGAAPKPGTASHRGGGGGGGAVGIVRIDSPHRDIDPSAVTSPAPLP